MYEAPQIDDLGTVAELTESYKNKIGATPDVTSNISGIVGSIVVIHP